MKKYNLENLGKSKSDKLKIRRMIKEHNIYKNERNKIENNKIFSLTLGKNKIFVRKRSAWSSLLIYHWIFNLNDHTFIEEFTGKNEKIILDIGAHEGFYTLKIKENNPRVKVIAVEPNPLCFEILKKNITSNKIKNVLLINKAIYKENKKISFEINEYNSAFGKIKKLKKDFGLKEKWKNMMVPAITLESLLKKYNINNVDILKIDAEGSEEAILESSINILKKIKKITIEYHLNKDKIKKILLQNGFRLLHEYEGCVKNCGNLFFINENFIK